MQDTIKSYQQLQPEDRMTLASLRQQNFSLRAIARVLGRAPSTISREIERNTSEGRYASVVAQRTCAHRRQLARPTPKLHGDSVLFAVVQHFLQTRWWFYGGITTKIAQLNEEMCVNARPDPVCSLCVWACVSLVLLSGICTKVCAQGQNQASIEQLKQSAFDAGGAIYKRKNGQSLTFEEIAKLPDDTKKAIFDDEMTDEEFATYEAWLKKKIAVANAQADKQAAATAEAIAQADKQAAATAEARAQADKQAAATAEARARRDKEAAAAAEARARRDKEKADYYAWLEVMANKTNPLADFYVSIIKSGKKLNKDDRQLIEHIFKLSADLLRLGMREDTLNKLKVIMANSRNFED